MYAAKRASATAPDVASLDLRDTAAEGAAH
jgi:hypothetical protein